jgi:pimeloyl-ACP methyl ester carboxylesterase
VPDDANALSIQADGVTLSGAQSGEGQAIVLLHGLTATRRYVVMGSRALERSGYRVILYDARGHGRSTPAADRAYDYEHLAADLLAVLDAAGVERAVLAGASMGAHTIVRFVLEHRERVAAMALITPAYEPSATEQSYAFERWDRLARGLREGGVDGFVQAYDIAAVPEAWRGIVETVLRQRLSAHEHPAAVADALERVPRSQPFQELAQLRELSLPTLVVGSRDEADPEHPLAVAERYADAIPGARLIVEEPLTPPRSPIAWQGGQLSKLLIELAATAN